MIGLAQATRCCRQDTAFCEGVTFQQFVIPDALAKHRAEDIRFAPNSFCGKSTTTRLVNPLIQKGLVNAKSPTSIQGHLCSPLTENGGNVYQTFSVAWQWAARIESL